MRKRFAALMALGLAAGITGLVSAQSPAPPTNPLKGNPDLKGEITLFSWAEASYSSVLAEFNKLYPTVANLTLMFG